MAISLTCRGCNVTTQRPRESWRVCPRCESVIPFSDSLLDTLFKERALPVESAAQNVRNALTILQAHFEMCGCEGVQLSQDDVTAVMLRLHAAITQLERI